MIIFKVKSRVTSEPDGQAAQYDITLQEVKEEGQETKAQTNPPNQPSAAIHHQAQVEREGAITFPFKTSDPKRGELFAPGKLFNLVPAKAK
jgi:hypothetical protein